MNMQSTILGVIILALLGFGGYAYLYGMRQGDSAVHESGTVESAAVIRDEMLKRTNSTSTEENMTVKGEEGTMVGRGTYEAYGADKLTLAKNGKVVLFFHASWCPICIAMEKDILAHPSSIPAGVHILKVDYD